MNNNKIDVPIIVIKGNNFIAEHLYLNFKRYSLSKTHYIDEIDNDKKYDIIIDCTFNEKSQNDTLKYCVENNINKVLILNHWKKNINEFNNIKIIQLIVPDVYGKDHMSFNRPGPGNNYDSIISYCTFISESIRRIHEAKIGFIPNIYLTYGEDRVKYLFVENLYKPVQYIIDNVKESTEYELYDEERTVYQIISLIKEITGYKGNVVFENINTIYSKPIKRLNLNYKFNNLHYNIKNIYNYLIYNNNRFIID